MKDVGDIRASGLDYEKGATLMFMLESWLGPDQLRKGIRRYLTRYADRNASADDFIKAIEEATGKELRTILSTFLEQPGVPQIMIALRCDPGSPPTLLLEQKQHLAAGAQDAAVRRWNIPVCISYQAGDRRFQERILLTDRQARRVLGKTAACPEWIHANDGAAGYYRVQYEGDLLERLIGELRAIITHALHTTPLLPWIGGLSLSVHG